MDKRKLVGTIVGVTMFAALIAGATYAFLTLTATVENGTYNGSSMNFLVDYTRGTDIDNVPQLTNATASQAKSLVVKAAKHAGSPGGDVTIKLNTLSNNAITSSGVLNYAICRGECQENFSNARKGTVTTGATLNAQGEVESAAVIDMLTEPLEANAVSYYVYFWLDSAKITTEHIGKQYSGYISASAVQSEN